MTLPLHPDDIPGAALWARERRRPLRREMDAAVLRIDVRAAAVLRELGLPVPLLHAAQRIGMVVAETDAQDYWQPAESGRPLLVVPLEEAGALIDLVAFDPLDPDLWFLRTGAGWALGHDAVAAAMGGGWVPGDGRLLLHPRPLDWLASGGAGACVTRWCDEARGTLRALATIEVSAPATAAMLREELARPPRLPDIRVARWGGDAA